MPSQLAEKSPPEAVIAPSARASVDGPRNRATQSNGSRSIAQRGKTKATLSGTRVATNLTAPELEVLRIIGEDAERNGTSKLTLRQINQIIRKARAEKKTS